MRKHKTKWRDIKTAPKDGTPIMAIAKRHGWPGPGVRCCVVWSWGRWVIYGACNCEPSRANLDIQPLDEVQPFLWMHLPGLPAGFGDET